ncbi:MAG: [protein-PII] uridylyltransferase, partial [Desulfuromonadales bacterium]|nr:[protein-PII] uridylyltransferase [Desulfuromonadales bacterium]
MINGIGAAALDNLQSRVMVGNDDFDSGRGLLIAAAQTFLDTQLQEIQFINDQGASGWEVVKQLTNLFDQLCINLFSAASVGLSEAEVVGCALIAVGGYGRAEMNPRSDLDLMFYYHPSGKDAARVIADRMLYLLWDLHLDVGYSIRSSEECLEESADCTVRSALLDARLIAGREELFSSFRHNVGRLMLNRDTAGFIKLKLAERAERKKKYGSSVYLLEPNLKEGEGGLRELQEALWIARVKFKSADMNELLRKGVINEQDRHEYAEALDYLWRIRNFLHFNCKRKSDQLTFELQQQIAVALGYKNSRRNSAVEQFMREYYNHAFQVEHLATKLILTATQPSTNPRSRFFKFYAKRNLEDGFYIVHGILRAKTDQRLLDDPVLMMVAFELTQKHEVQMCIELKQLIRDNCFLINDKIRRSKRINESFIKILRHPRGASHILRKMHHLQFLNAFIPEFKKIYCRVQFDQYHIYTVDIHTLFA